MKMKAKTKISNLLKDKNLVKEIFPYSVSDYQTINPLNNSLSQKFSTLSSMETSKLIQKSQLSYVEWKVTSLETRFSKFKNLAACLEKNTDKIAEMMALEMGKPVTQGIGEVKKCIGHINYYIQNTEEFTKNKAINFEGFNNEIHFKPVGPILSINPWNFPFWVPFKSIIPSMMVGMFMSFIYLQEIL